MALMFTLTPSIKKAVSLINDVADSKFPLLLSRIINKLHLKDETTFSEEEQVKLAGVFALENQDLQLVIESCEFFLHQAAYHTSKPAVLKQQLEQLELAESKVEALVEVWVKNAPQVVEKLRQRTVATTQLEDINWQLNLQMAQDNKTKMKLPNAVFELGINSEDSQTKEKVLVEFTHEELYAFYNQLETIQGQIDALN